MTKLEALESMRMEDNKNEPDMDEKILMIVILPLFKYLFKFKIENGLDLFLLS